LKTKRSPFIKENQKAVSTYFLISKSWTPKEKLCHQSQRVTQNSETLLVYINPIKNNNNNNNNNKQTNKQKQQQQPQQQQNKTNRDCTFNAE
jgi:hypothetical protein